MTREQLSNMLGMAAVVFLWGNIRPKAGVAAGIYESTVSSSSYYAKCLIIFQDNSRQDWILIVLIRKHYNNVTHAKKHHSHSPMLCAKQQGTHSSGSSWNLTCRIESSNSSRAKLNILILIPSPFFILTAATFSPPVIWAEALNILLLMDCL